MKQLVVLLGFVLLTVGGCQEVSQTKSGVEVVTEDNGEFPEFLAGTWKCDGQVIEVVFEPNGIISSAVMPLGEERMKPDEMVEFNNVDVNNVGAKGFFKAGRRWAVHYAPASRELEVELSLEQYRVEMAGGEIIEGKSRDVFAGKVSDDGNTWQADWFAFPEYYVITDTNKNSKLPVDINDNPVATLIFRKVTSPPPE